MSNDKPISKNSSNPEIYSNIKKIIEESRLYAVSQVNYSLVIAYWNIGKLIKEKIVDGERADYGKGTLKTLGDKLSFEYGNGFSEANLSRMAKFYAYFKEKEILVTLSQKFSWSHFVEFIRMDDELGSQI